MQNFTINAQIFALGSSVVLNLYQTNLTGGLISSNDNKKGFEQSKDRITNQLAKTSIPPKLSGPVDLDIFNSFSKDFTLFSVTTISLSELTVFVEKSGNSSFSSLVKTELKKLFSSFALSSSFVIHSPF